MYQGSRIVFLTLTGLCGVRNIEHTMIHVAVRMCVCVCVHVVHDIDVVCLSLHPQLEKTGRIEDQLQSELTLIIRERCTDCYTFSTAFLRQGQFLCHDNPTTATYRSTLINPFPTTNSTQLVGIIQSWVSACPSLIIDGLVVRVYHDVPTCIPSLHDGECVDDVESVSGVAEVVSQVLSVCAVRALGQEICTI